ncbi:MAG: alpha/beta hydrolase, partial [Promethearchaeota archaeon]
ESNSFVREAYEYYVGNQDRYPTWKNQVDASAFANLAAFDIKSIVSSLTPTPVLFIAGTNAVTGPLSQNAYDNANEPKELFWVDGATHISMYYNEKHINQASEKLDEFFKENLK